MAQILQHKSLDKNKNSNGESEYERLNYPLKLRRLLVRGKPVKYPGDEKTRQ